MKKRKHVTPKETTALARVRAAAFVVGMSRRRPRLQGTVVGMRGRVWRQKPGRCRVYFAPMLPELSVIVVSPRFGDVMASVEMQKKDGRIWAADVVTMKIGEGKRVDQDFYLMAVVPEVAAPE